MKITFTVEGFEEEHEEKITQILEIMGELNVLGFGIMNIVDENGVVLMKDCSPIGFRKGE